MRYNPGKSDLARARKIENKAQKREDGKVYCICGRYVSVKRSGGLRRHKTPQGDECTHRASYNRRGVDGIEVVLPDAPGPEPLPPPLEIPKPESRREQNRRAVRGICRICEKLLYGERTLCGACGVRLNRGR